jgi:hypothetical protein
MHTLERDIFGIEMLPRTTTLKDFDNFERYSVTLSVKKKDEHDRKVIYNSKLMHLINVKRNKN